MRRLICVPPLASALSVALSVALFVAGIVAGHGDAAEVRDAG